MPRNFIRLFLLSSRNFLKLFSCSSPAVYLFNRFRPLAHGPAVGAGPMLRNKLRPRSPRGDESVVLLQPLGEKINPEHVQSLRAYRCYVTLSILRTGMGFQIVSSLCFVGVALVFIRFRHSCFVSLN